MFTQNNLHEKVFWNIYPTETIVFLNGFIGRYLLEGNQTLQLRTNKNVTQYVTLKQQGQTIMQVLCQNNVIVYYMLVNFGLGIYPLKISTRKSVLLTCLGPNTAPMLSLMLLLPLVHSTVVRLPCPIWLVHVIRTPVEMMQQDCKTKIILE